MGSSGSRTREKRGMTRMEEAHHHSDVAGSKSFQKTTCVLDDQILNRYTIHHMTNLGLSIFADVCGRNRGVFVDVAPSEQQGEQPTATATAATYSCLTLPPSFAKGLPESVPMATSNDIGTLLLLLLLLLLLWIERLSAFDPKDSQLFPLCC
jgi:hypothetical protein